MPAQSHLNENLSEIEWVKALCPDKRDYCDTYDAYGLLGDVPTVMAHCIYGTEREKQLLKDKRVMIAHCPTSNSNVIAGLCPAAAYLRGGWEIGLGSDVAGGHTLNLFEVMVYTVQVSKMKWMLEGQKDHPLSMAEAFYMATAGGGRFFGKVGLFEPGYAFDALVLDESKLASPRSFNPAERLERYAYQGNGLLKAKYVDGRRML